LESQFERAAVAPRNAMKNALIVGGGFSGMAAAIEFRKAGFEVTLVELDPEWRSYGAGISLGGPTLRAFRTLGILEAFLQHGYAADGLALFAPNGTQVGAVPTPRVAGPDVPGGGAIMRPVLAKIMAEATRERGTRVLLGMSVTQLNDRGDHVDVQLSNGETARFDLVVGADGVGSFVRGYLFPDAPRPTYIGQGVWRAVLPRPESVTGARMWVGGKVKPGLNPVSKAEMYLFLTEQRRDNHRIDPSEFVPRLKDLLAEFPDPVLQQVRAQLGGHSRIVYRPLENMLLPRPWHRGRVVLIGDAVHATTPHLASGACIGIEDAIVLAEELKREASVAMALEVFEQRRFERCRMVVENSARLGQIEIEGGDMQEHARIMKESIIGLSAPLP
jgi:2-polyprenyl-6-methoxyphenol hydroxylase-like FAD-dependent oxidoreductase